MLMAKTYENNPKSILLDNNSKTNPYTLGGCISPAHPKYDSE